MSWEALLTNPVPLWPILGNTIERFAKPRPQGALLRPNRLTQEANTEQGRL